MTRSETRQGSEHQPQPPKSNHKNYGGEKTHPPEVLLRWFNGNGYAINFDLWTEGGIVRTQDANKPAGYVRPPLFRQEKGSPDITTSDVRPITTENKPNDALGFEHAKTGKELELFGFDPGTGELASLMNHGDRFYTVLNAADPDAKRTAWTKEKLRNCVERDLGNGTGVPLEALAKLKTIVAIAEESDVLIAPLANIPHRGIAKSDITKGEYTNRMTFDVHGWEGSRFYDVSSQQHHIEVLDHEAARQTLNYLQFVNHILLAPTLCGPFTQGEIKPNLVALYENAPDIAGDARKEKTLDWLEDGTYQSYRTLGRFFGSSSGGILREPIPVQEGKFYTYLENRLKQGNIPSAGRAGGNHADRYRPDILPYGTLELCGLDPAGGRVQRIATVGEFTRALGWKMQTLMVTGQFDEKAREYAALFGREPSVESFETAHWNFLETTKNGTNAKVAGMDGESYHIRTMHELLKKFAQEPLVNQSRDMNYQGVPQGILGELDRAYKDPSGLFNRYRDKNGFTSTRGYYEMGIGNLSEWMLQGARERMAAGMSEKDAIMEVTKDVGRSFHHHIKTMQQEDLERPFAK